MTQARSLFFAAVCSALVASAIAIGFSQGGAYTPGTVLSVVSSLPVTCTPPNIVILSSDATIHLCVATDTFAAAQTTNVAATAASGGTGLSTYAVGDLIYASATTPTLSRLADVTAGSYLRAGGVNTAPVWSTLVLPNTATTGNILTVTGTNTVTAVTPASAHSTPGNQSGNATSTFKMNGSACALTTTTYSGRAVFAMMGTFSNGTAGDAINVKMAYGTGSAPANADAAIGTVTTSAQKFTTGSFVGAAPTASFAFIIPVTGLSLSTAYWFDLQVQNVTGGTATVTNVDCSAYEF